VSEDDAKANHQLIAVMTRLKVGNKSLARRIRDLSEQERPGHGLRTDHVTVLKWRRGAQPRPDTARLIAEVLSRQAGERITLADIGMAGDSVDDTDAALAYPDTVIESISRLGALARHDVAGDARLIGQDAAHDAWTQPMLLWILARPDADVSRFSGRRVGAGDVEAVRETTRMFLGLDFRYGGGHARTALVQYFAQDVVPLLEGSYSDDIGRQLYTAAAEVAQLLGWTAYDLGRHGLAQRYFIQALRLAQAADNRNVAARLLSNLSHQSNYLGRFQAAAQLARAAQEGAKATASPAAMSMFLAMEARALAGAQDKRGVTTVLRDAEAVFRKSDLASEPAWISYFDEAELAGEAAHCFRDLKSPREAHEFVSRAIELTGPSYVRTLAFVRLVQAAAYVQQDEPATAASIMASVVENSMPLKSERVLRYLRDLIEDLKPYSNTAEVRSAVSFVQVHAAG